MSVTMLAKRACRAAGLEVSRRDRLAEQIPEDYLRSPYLPAIYRQSLGRLLYFGAMFERIREVMGDIVECGVSTGAGLLNWCLLTELSSERRTIYGFDSFEGFPASTDADRTTLGSFTTERGDYASAPELVLKVLDDGRVSRPFVESQVRLVRGFFERTLPGYRGRIALLHLDCDLHDSYITCLTQLYGKVVPGGLIMFDEYEDDTFPGAKKAIDAFFADKPEKPTAYSKYQYMKYYVQKA